jgi:hypothetical protein
MVSSSFGKISGILLFCLAAAASASAQYGGGGTGGTGTGTGGTGSSSYGSGNGKAIGIGVGAAAGAAVGIGLLVHHHHVVQARSQVALVGCTQSLMNGLTLKNENDNVTYTILSRGTSLHPGQRVELTGVVSDEKSDLRTFKVHQLINNFGACGSTSAAAQKPAAQTIALAQPATN